MSKRKRRCLRWSSILVLLSWIGVGIGSSNLKASPAVFAIDPDQSHLTLAATLVGLALDAQDPGSLTTVLRGSVNAEVTPTTLQFTGLSGVAAATNGSWQPLSGGLPGTAPADFGAKGQVALLGTIQIAIRDLVLDLRSEVLPMQNAGFDASGIRFVVSTNSPTAFDYRVGSARFGSRVVAGVATNQVTSRATLVDVARVQTLQFDIDARFPFAAFIPDDSLAAFSGSIVATRSLAGSVAVPPVVRSISLQNARVVVRVTGEPGREYRLESCRILPEWIPRPADLTMDGGDYLLVTDRADASEFFRVAY